MSLILVFDPEFHTIIGGPSRLLLMEGLTVGLQSCLMKRRMPPPPDFPPAIWIPHPVEPQLFPFQSGHFTCPFLLGLLSPSSKLGLSGEGLLGVPAELTSQTRAVSFLNCIVGKTSIQLLGPFPEHMRASFKDVLNSCLSEWRLDQQHWSSWKVIKKTEFQNPLCIYT